MKKLAFLICVAVLSFTACKKDSDSDTGSNKLVGVWEGVEANMVVYNEDGEKVSETNIPFTSPNSLEVRFNANGTFTSNVKIVEPAEMEDEVTAKGEYEVKGSVLVLKQEGEEPMDIPYTLNGNTLKIVMGVGGGITTSVTMRKKG